MIESQSEAGNIDLYYGDETQVSQQAYVPYGWQFDDEDVYIPATKGRAINCFGLISRSNHLITAVSEKNITADFVIEQLDRFSLQINRFTVVVLDNARIHTARSIKERLPIWQNRDLFIFYLPPYSPHLNIIERFWKELKEGWVRPQDYDSADSLFYAVNRIFANVGKEVFLNFNPFNG